MIKKNVALMDIPGVKPEYLPFINELNASDIRIVV